MRIKTNAYAFDKNVSNALKGVFLLLMFVLHFCCFPSYYIEGLMPAQSSFMEQFQGNFQICVAGFAFLTGFLYHYAKEKCLRYTVKKWLGLLIPYWVVFFIVLLFAVLLGCYHFVFRDFILEFFAIDRDIMCFCWYVPFYIAFILFLQILTSCFSGKHCVPFILAFGFMVPIAFFYASLKVVNHEMITPLLEKFQVFAPIGVVGYVTSKTEIFQRVEKKIANKGVAVVLSIGLLVFVFSQPTWLYLINDGIIIKMFQKAFRAFSIPLFVFALVVLFKNAPKALMSIFVYIGKYSMYLWFIHCVFFNVMRDCLQPIVFFSNNAVVNVVLGLMLSLMLAVVVDYPTQKILKTLHI